MILSIELILNKCKQPYSTVIQKLSKAALKSVSCVLLLPVTIQ